MVYAAQASFYILIALIPFIMLLLSLVRFWIPLTVEDVILAMQAFSPTGLHPYIADFVRELFSKSTIPLISVTAVTTLWTASRGFAAAERGVRRVYRVPEGGLVWRVGLAMLYTLAFSLILLLTLALLVFGKGVYLVLDRQYPVLMSVFARTKGVRPFLYFLGVCLLFALVYKAFSGWRTPYKMQIPGAVFTAAGWMIFSQLYSIYIGYFANYSYIYGSLTAIVLLMLWLYSCMIILLLGAEVNVAVDRKMKGMKNK